MSARNAIRVLAGAAAVLAAGAAVALAAGLDLFEPDPGAQFRVDGNRIVAPNGRELVIKGVVMPYGTFAGGDAAGYGRDNERTAARDFRRVRRLGANTVKVYVTTKANRAGDRRRLRRIVDQARSAGLLVVITNGFSSYRSTVRWLRYLAREYKGDPWVWLLPMNEPNCQFGAKGGPDCVDWRLWQRQHRRYLSVIRGAGMRAPVMVNGPAYSWDLSKVDDYPLGDRQVVYGAHRYANDSPYLGPKNRREIERGWARLARDRAVVLDELGNWDGPQFANSLRWTREMVAFTRHWVQRREGAGAVAFNWHWSDPNTMTRADGRLTSWGRAFVNGYLRRVRGYR